MTVDEIRDKFLKFFAARGHAILPSVSLVTVDERGVANATLFNTAGMQPLIPYLLGEPHSRGKRVASVQKCLRTVDIDQVGDNTHLTFFEMLGNWSFGDYFKAEAIKWSFEFLTSTSEGLGLDPSRLYVTVFAGDENAPRDNDAYDIWKEIFSNEGLKPETRIFFMPADSNWWSPGDNGPCGPDSEMFYDLSNQLTVGLTKEEFIAADKRQNVVEIWNDVFMEYEKKAGKITGKLAQKNVDTGAGLERLATVLQGKDNVYEIDLFIPLMKQIENLATNHNLQSARIVADHIRAVAFLISDGVVPSNTDRGYILRRLLRRGVRHTDLIGLPAGSLSDLSATVAKTYESTYPKLSANLDEIKKEVKKEEIRFRKTLAKGLKEFERGADPFILFSTYGFPFELTKELALEKGIKIDEDKFWTKMEAHQKLSRAGAEQKFKGGLADQSEQVIKYHTATHLLHQALRDVLGPELTQKGSNITDERLRFDFSCLAKMTEEQKQAVEKIVNDKIKADLPVKQVILPKTEAEKSGANHLFSEKYGDEVSVYFIGSDLASAYSKEFCGGPHVVQTGELGHFKIIKEEAVAAGVRRIKAVLR